MHITFFSSACLWSGCGDRHAAANDLMRLEKGLESLSGGIEAP
jgi:hypothetical protein